MNAQDYLSLDALAARLKLPRPYLREQVEARHIPALRIGRVLRFDEAAVRDALRRLAERETESEAGHEPLDTPATSPDLAAIAADVKALREIVAAKLSAPAPAAFSDTDSPQHPRP